MGSICMRVSKGWLFAIRDDPGLWTEVCLNDIKYPPTNSALCQLVKRASLASSLVVRDARRLGLDHAKFSFIFNGLPRLRHLHLHGPPAAYAFYPDKYAGGYPTALTSLSLTGIISQGNDNLLGNLLRSSRNTLRDLSLVGTRELVQDQFAVLLPNLTTLKLQCSPDQSIQGVIHYMVAPLALFVVDR